MPTWAVVILIAAALAAVYMYMKHKKHTGAPVMGKKPGSKKSRWRRAIGSASKMAGAAGVAIPGAAQLQAASNIASAGGLI